MSIPHRDDYRPPRGTRWGIWFDRFVCLFGIVAFLFIVWLFGDTVIR